MNNTHTTHTHTHALTRPPLLVQTSTRRASTRRAVALFATPHPPPLTHACCRTGCRAPLLPRRRRCALARSLRQLLSCLHVLALLAQTTRSCRRCGLMHRLLNLRAPCAQLVLTPCPFMEQISENAEKLQCASRGSNPSPHCPTVVATRAHRRSCLRRMGEISMM